MYLKRSRYLLTMNYGHLQIVRYHHMFQVFPESMLKEPSLFLKKTWEVATGGAGSSELD